MAGPATVVPAPVGTGGPGASPSRLLAAAWLVGGSVTAAVALSPGLIFGFFRPDLHLVLDTVDGIIAALVAALLLDRARRRGSLSDQLLGECLAVLAVISLVISVGAELSGLDTDAAVWVQLILRAAASVFVLASALVGVSSPRGTGHRRRLLVLVVLTVAVLPVAPLLPPAVSASVADQQSRVDLSGHPALVAVQALSALAFLVAAVLLSRRLLRGGDRLTAWIAPAVVLAAFARVNYALFPSIYSGWFYTGDVLRTASYVVLLVGALLEVRANWAGATRTAVEDERRRLARELHDGVAQEIALIRVEALRLDRPRPGDGAAEIVDAADRALEETRTTIDALTTSPDEPLDVVLDRSARRVAARYGARVESDCTPLALSPEARHHLVRIVREAALNAVRHGGAPTVEVRLRPVGSGGRLVVSDDGSGFDPDALAAESGFGISGIRQRAEALGGRLELSSAPGVGTVVEVTW